LHDERASQYSITITAKTGHIVTESNSALLYMEDGTVQKFNYLSRKSEILNFDSYVFNLSDNQKSSTKFHWKAKERYLRELLNPESDSEDIELRRYRAELHQRFTYPLLPIIFSIIALTCILRGEFSRKGSSSNIVLASLTAAIFLGLIMVSYDLIESSPKFTPVLYLNFIVFFVISLRPLISNFSHKNEGKIN